MITTITMTPEQVSDLAELTTLSDDWFERLADITECNPNYLRTRVNEDVLIEKIKPPAWDLECREEDILFFVTPVEQQESGVLKEVR